MELINEVSDECLWGEVHNPLLIPAALKTSLSIGVWCEALIFQSTEHYTVFHIQSTASFDFPCKENSTAVSQPGYPTNQEQPPTNSSNALAKPVLKVGTSCLQNTSLSLHSSNFYTPSNFCHGSRQEFIDNDHITVQSRFISKDSPSFALKKMIILWRK